MNVIFVGASITQGYWDTDGGWVTRIAKRFIKQAIETDDYDIPMVFNLGISGDNADKILKRLDVELMARVDGREDIVVFSFGTNDSSVRGGKPVSSPEKFMSDLAKVKEISEKYVDEIIFMNILPCDETRTQPVAWNDAVYYYNQRIDSFNDAVSQFCEKNSLKMIDIFTPFSLTNTNSRLLIDGLHPDTAGHQLIAEVVTKELEGAL
jgi:lysophospholipase L1-like esterase